MHIQYVGSRYPTRYATTARQTITIRELGLYEKRRAFDVSAPFLYNELQQYLMCTTTGDNAH